MIDKSYEMNIQKTMYLFPLKSQHFILKFILDWLDFVSFTALRNFKWWILRFFSDTALLGEVYNHTLVAFSEAVHSNDFYTVMEFGCQEKKKMVCTDGYVNLAEVSRSHNKWIDKRILVKVTWFFLWDEYRCWVSATWAAVNLLQIQFNNNFDQRLKQVKSFHFVFR